MLGSIHLYLKFVRMNIKGQMQYRSSFIMGTAGQLLVTFLEFFGITALFTRFGTIRGWKLPEVAMFYGLVSISFALSEGFARGFDKFDQQVITGEFDRTLLRPRTTSFQVLSHEFLLTRGGRFLQGLVFTVWGSVTLGLEWSPAKLALAVFAVLTGVMIFTGLLIMQAAMCFWSTQSLEVMNSFTYGGIEASQWPLPVLSGWFSRIFIFVIPLAFVNYFPLLAILGKPDAFRFPVWVQWASPAVGIIFLTVSLEVWGMGVRHYRSTGS